MTSTALPITDLTRARHDIVTSSAGGAPFLICFGATIALAGLVWPLLPVKIAALVVMFQGNLALPAAFWLERRMGWTTMAADNPLKSLSIQLAMSQIVAFPAVIVAYALSPAAVPVTLAAIAGGHFLPYSWLQRTPVYIALAIAVSAGASRSRSRLVWRRRHGFCCSCRRATGSAPPRPIERRGGCASMARR